MRCGVGTVVRWIRLAVAPGMHRGIPSTAMLTYPGSVLPHSSRVQFITGGKPDRRSWPHCTQVRKPSHKYMALLSSLSPLCPAQDSHPGWSEDPTSTHLTKTIPHRQVQRQDNSLKACAGARQHTTGTLCLLIWSKHIKVLTT